ncbi:hypothetical protein [Streptomyces olindensis]|uniref:hypothetical protein n=1 Tax=Streptomyces olindensis TaxID=358823 RepID=UPI00340DE636
MTAETISSVNVEYEHKWRIDHVAADWNPEEPENGDGLVRKVLDSVESNLGATAGELHTFTQSAIYFDTPSWDLAENDISLAALVNYGALSGTGWLVLKETVRWHGDRREALEVAESVPTRELTRRMSRGDLAPLRRIERRLPVAAESLRPYAKAVQRRRKALLRLDGGAVLATTLDSSKLSGADQAAESGAAHWWFEAEVNSGDLRVLDVLEATAAAVRSVFAVEADHTTKPQEAARLAGWGAAGR